MSPSTPLRTGLDPLRLGTIAGVVALAGAVAYLRFCGEVGLPPKPPPPATGGPASDTLERVAGSSDAWIKFVAADAATAGVATPSAADMSKKLLYRVDEQPFSLAPGEGSKEVAGVKLTAVAVDDAGSRKILALEIENRAGADLAYRVVTDPRPGGAACNQRGILSHDAIVVRQGAKVVRSECVFRPGMALRISRVETMELKPLMAFYVSRVPPAALGADPRLARGHQPDLPAQWTVCTTVASQAVRADIESGRIAWRDLVDFYARHGCDRYRYSEGYRAFEKDGQRPLPAVD